MEMKGDVWLFKVGRAGKGGGGRKRGMEGEVVFTFVQMVGMYIVILKRESRTYHYHRYHIKDSRSCKIVFTYVHTSAIYIYNDFEERNLSSPPCSDSNPFFRICMLQYSRQSRTVVR